MKIRQGQKEDMPAVLTLIKELATFEKEPEAVIITVDDLIRDGFGESPLFHTFVAVVNDNSSESIQEEQIVGVALYYYRYSTWKGRTIHLEDLIVKEEMRGSGIGKALYKEVIAQGKKDKVNRIEWAVLDWNTTAIDFYEKSGAKVLKDWRVAQMDKNGIDNFLTSL